jgi:Trypsin-like peptidase domain
MAPGGARLNNAMEGHPRIDALAAVGRANPKGAGSSPFSAFGSGVCVHPDGVVLAAWHTLENFFRTWTLFDMEQLERSHYAETPDEMLGHEAPRVRLFKPFPPDGAVHSFPMLGGIGEQQRDLVLLELGGGGRFRPLPNIPISMEPPKLDVKLGFSGISVGPDTPRDSFGMPQGMRLEFLNVQVVGRDERYVYLDHEFRPGNSGGPLVDLESQEVTCVAVGNIPASDVTTELHSDRTTLGRAVLLGDVSTMFERLEAFVHRRVASGGISWCGLSDAGEHSAGGPSNRGLNLTG